MTRQGRAKEPLCRNLSLCRKHSSTLEYSLLSMVNNTMPCLFVVVLLRYPWIQNSWINSFIQVHMCVRVFFPVIKCVDGHLLLYVFSPKIPTSHPSICFEFYRRRFYSVTCAAVQPHHKNLCIVYGFQCFLLPNLVSVSSPSRMHAHTV